jgi:hypothetical protein
MVDGATGQVERLIALGRAMAPQVCLQHRRAAPG